MCIYEPTDDKFISNDVIQGRLWEADTVNQIVRLLKAGPRRQLVDIGANLGVYTLPVAHAGINVLTVEASWETVRRLARSIHVGNLMTKFTLLHNAVSNTHTVVSLHINPTNRGGTEIQYRFVNENGNVIYIAPSIMLNP